MIVCRVLAQGKMDVIRLPRKSAKQILYSPVPQTDTRSRVEYTKALERLTVKELGKLTL